MVRIKTAELLLSSFKFYFFVLIRLGPKNRPGNDRFWPVTPWFGEDSLDRFRDLHSNLIITGPSGKRMVSDDRSTSRDLVPSSLLPHIMILVEYKMT